MLAAQPYPARSRSQFQSPQKRHARGRELLQALVSRIPLGRIAEPEDVMRAVLFFVSPASDLITGETLYVDCGITATQ